MEFPGGPVVSIPGAQCFDQGSVPGQGTEIPQVTQSGQKKKKKAGNGETPKLTQFGNKAALFFLTHSPGGSGVKASASNAGDPGSILGSGRSPGEGNGSPLQYSCRENPMDTGAW